MKKEIILFTVFVVVLLTAFANYEKKDVMNIPDLEDNKDLFPKGEIIEGPNFTGTAWLHMLVSDASNFDCTIGNVTFEPGCRNNWHSHPGGQILLVTEGTGYYQEKGKPIQLLKKGDVVEIFPNIVHWHGATPDSPFSHLAITTRSSAGVVVWLEPVSEEEYNNFK